MNTPDADPDAALRPHLAAVGASMRAGFRFRHLPSTADIRALQGFRMHRGALDVYLVHAPDEAIAARFRLEDMERPAPQPLWHERGAVADVVTALLALPDHGASGAPARTRHSPSCLWVPGNAWT